MDNEELEISCDKISNLETGETCAEPLTENFQLSGNVKKHGKIDNFETQSGDEKELRTYQTISETSIEEIHFIKL